jgi:hypothetical protein
MKVKVYLPQKRALQLGIVKWGHVEVDFQEVLNHLAEAERMALQVTNDGVLEVRKYSDSFSSQYGAVRVEDATVEATVNAIFKTLSDNDEKRKELLTKLEEMLEKPAQFLGADGSRLWHHNEEAVKALCKKAKVEPQPYQEALDSASQVAREAWCDDWRRWFDEWTPGVPPELKPPYHRNYGVAVDQTLSLYIAKEIARDLGFPEVLQRIDVYEKASMAAKIEAENLNQVSQAQWIDWARQHGSADLKAAIADGYPLGFAVEREVEAELFPEPGSSAIEVREKVVDSEERRVPNQAARSLQAYLMDQVVSVTAIPKGAKLSVGRIQAVKYWQKCSCGRGPEMYIKCDECDDDNEIEMRRTAVPVYLKALHHEATRWYVIVE